ANLLPGQSTLASCHRPPRRRPRPSVEHILRRHSSPNRTRRLPLPEPFALDVSTASRGVGKSIVWRPPLQERWACVVRAEPSPAGITTHNSPAVHLPRS